jgi:hypothetical protein
MKVHVHKIYFYGVLSIKIVLGQHAKNRVFLPRIFLCPSDNEMFLVLVEENNFP